MLKKHPLLARLGLTIILPATICLLWLINQLQQSLGPYEGELELPNLQDKVTVTFDAQGVALVNAQNDRDAFYTQGYLHARDRMWQLELQRRLVQGKLSEIFSTQAVQSDVWMRTLGLYEAAKHQWDNLTPAAKASLNAYSEGVNSWLETNDDHGPEFNIFAITPKPWTPIDSLAWQKILALNLSQNLFAEISRHNTLKSLSDEQLKAFFPHDPILDLSKKSASESTGNNPGKNSDNRSSKNANTIEHNQNPQLAFNDWHQVQSQLRQQHGLQHRFAGSNGWAIAGIHTQSGFPMLANDPHLGVQMPSIWYALSLKGDKLNATGMSLVGLPGIMLGRNESISWGVTNLMADNQDLFILDIPVQNNQTYLTDKGPQPITSRQEVIHIAPVSPQFLNKKINPITIEIRTTALGPIISDVVRETNEVVALRWSALDQDDSSYESFFKVQYAQDWQQFRQALRLLKTPGLHFFYADNKGNIGSQVAGHLPHRGKGVGTLPLSAANSANYWQGYADFDRLPYQYNPPEGYVVSANAYIKSEPDIIISHEWASPYRKKRAQQLIAQGIKQQRKFTHADLQQMQVDYIDLGAKSLLPLLNKTQVKQSILSSEQDKDIKQQALNILDSWDGSFAPTSQGASIYHYWLADLKIQIFDDELSPVWRSKSNAIASLASEVTTPTLIQLLTNKQNPWCEQSDCHNELVESFKQAISALKKQTGSDSPEDWHWGQLHHAEYAHQPFGQVKLLDKYFKTRIEVGGTPDTLNASTAFADAKGGYIQVHGSTFRQVFDLGQPHGGAYIIASGQSGMFMSDHFDDMIEDFRDGKIYQYQNSDEQQSNSEKPLKTLTLLPRRS